MKAAIITVIIAAVLGMAAWSWLSPAGPQQSPDISLLGIDGKQLKLSSYRGRPLLVTFWATTCPGCLSEMPHLAGLYRELAPQGLEIIGVAMDYDPPNQVLALRNARRIPYPIALDIHADAARAFGDVRLTPTAFLIAPDGRIVYRKTGVINISQLRDDILALLRQARADQSCNHSNGTLEPCSG
jgi:peroxiredoxin